MGASDVVEVVRGVGVEVCLSGGWAVDALLGEQTRKHDDLDLWLPAVDLHRAFQGLTRLGIDRIFPWPGDRPWNFVLHDGARRRLDLHLYETRADGRIHYGSAVQGESFPAAALDGRGTVGGVPVRCEAVEWSLKWHSGYPPRDKDRHDMRLLRERFG
ncbi:aminoglycoside nucleotidyltransferase [Actinoplanes sp. LDG1-01]|uniref:Aminoglycoside nucleotidyltransferase n=2 Tax=Paractinoplanes lichenicola TaxID=2802976 RepID=A0ABS1VWZ5_9ACTN|nr:aminoglycoside nucleotidyltransferase [Actinoplanes lichenicola]